MIQNRNQKHRKLVSEVIKTSQMNKRKIFERNIVIFGKNIAQNKNQ